MMYLLIVTLVWATGLALYLGLLKKVPAYGFNRAFLLTTLLGGLLVPFIPVWSGGPEALPALVRNAAVQLPGVVITASGNPAITEAASTPWWLLLYGVGVAAAVGLFACSIYRLVQLFRKSTIAAVSNEEIDLVVRETGRPIAPFSFAKTLFVSEWDALSASEQDVLARHETAHHTHLHVIDNVLASIVVVFAWFNPLAYVIRKELRLVHEFQADARTLTNIDARSYREVLLRQQLGAPQLSLVASFAQSPLKTRFAMMTSSFRQNQFWRLGAALFCLVLVVAACTKEEIDDTDLADVTELNMGEEAIALAEAAMNTEGMTLQSVDTVTVYDPETYHEEVTAIEHWIGADGKTKNIVKELGIVDRDGNPVKLKSPGAEMFRSREVYKMVEEMPRFPGCENNGLAYKELQQCATKKMLEFIYGNIEYPKSARDAGIEGTGVVSFIVGTDGELLEPKVVRNPAGDDGGPIAEDFEKELLKITSEMPEWTPGKQQGKDVQVRFNLPVRFRLE